ncbi:MAG: bifunctional [glutamate--ammonia ligase]-adenylyl-L-tyrosine phosphorylase/[glutamate--ammonia-ligase] adenylyltransferase [Wenzhouxiangella sp.]|nr:MAG: bifunctional [glutamate--ammonia ligase]-adenylyl-L-tyrosine phosphorylase/[glutamate--ammonia-ligase] adenylyltransferase [Wenzhouxiangella sp.]
MKRRIDIEPGELDSLSAYVSETWRRFPEDRDPNRAPDPPGEDELHANPEQALRRFRQLSSVNILWRDLTGATDIAETGRAISALARQCLEKALTVAEERITKRHGLLLDEHDQPIRLAVLGLGKLGGDELNFNSDVDLVFAYEGRGRSQGPRRLDAAGWLKLVARELIGLMDSMTADGRVWIVDARLRPFGDAGALVWSNGAMEQYFLSEGRTWERYAWLKAGPVAGCDRTAGNLLDALTPFIFRRYLDYGIFDSLRDLHQRIDANSRARSRRDDIKRGPGGIRELEFLIQSHQLLRGGREPSLRERGFLPALAACTRLGQIKTEDSTNLEQAYGFLRVLENRLQAMTARQGHHLPEDETGRERLARLMGCASWSELSAEIDHHRRQVRNQFTTHFRTDQAAQETSLELWPPTADMADRLSRAGFEQPDTVIELLDRLHERTRSRALSAEGRRRLERLMPLLMAEAGQHSPAETGLEDLLRLIDQISRRSAYLSLLYERPTTLQRLIRVFRSSSRLADWIVAAPQLLDDLLDPVHGFDLPSPPQLEPNEVEANLHALGRWRQAGFLRTALAELDGRMDAAEAAERLTAIAAVIIERVLGMISEDEPDLAVIGYGNLGAGQLHYSSDLDLVFLHAEDPAPVRTAQRLISFMQMPLPGGRLFEIDTRLRPNGRSGMLVSRADSFHDYQCGSAWTWEHQALIRARWIAGHPDLAERFEKTRTEVLCRPRDPDQVRRELAEMRARQQRDRSEDPIKRRLTDLQYMAELGLLTNAADNPDLIDCRQPVAQFEALGDCGWLKADTASQLVSAWQALNRQRHRSWLLRDPEPEPASDLTDLVDRHWQLLLGESADK